MAQCNCGVDPHCPYDRPVVFRRVEGFYIVVGTDCENWSLHAELNPGTVEISDAVTGERLWPEGTLQ